MGIKHTFGQNALLGALVSNAMVRSIRAIAGFDDRGPVYGVVEGGGAGVVTSWSCGVGFTIKIFLTEMLGYRKHLILLGITWSIKCPGEDDLVGISDTPSSVSRGAILESAN